MNIRQIERTIRKSIKDCKKRGLPVRVAIKQPGLLCALDCLVGRSNSWFMETPKFLGVDANWVWSFVQGVDGDPFGTHSDKYPEAFRLGRKIRAEFVDVHSL